MIIDFHTHTFPERIAKKALSGLMASGNTYAYTDGTEDGLRRSMDEAEISACVVLPVATRPDQAARINHAFAENEEKHCPELIRFGAMHPDCADMREELRFLRDHGIPGIKLHPAFQKQDLNSLAMMRLIDAASELGLIVLVHAGMDVSFPEHNYASVDMLLQVLREVQPPKLIAAHMGGWGGWNDVELYLAGAPLWLDTAFSVGSVCRPDGTEQSRNLSDEVFVRLFRKHGTDRVLFGTDSPWASQKDYVSRMRELPLTEKEREQLFHENAELLLKLK